MVQLYTVKGAEMTGLGHGAGRVAYGVFSALAVLIALVSLRGLVTPLSVSMDHVVHYLDDGHAAALWLHIVAGPLALILVPLQFATRLRARWPRLHRWTGRVYVAACVAGGLGALAMLPGYQGSWFSGLGFAGLGLAWIGVTLTALVAIRQGDVARHRVWMIRSAALTAAAITLRLTMAPLMAAGWTVTQTYDVTAWSCWLVNLLIAELILRRRNEKGAPQGAFRPDWSGR